MMCSRAYALAFFLLLLSLWGNAQECNLNIAGEDTEVLKSVFQLNDDQMGQMQAWGAELRIETSAIEDSIQKLFDQHPQNTHDELILLADKYKVLQQKIVDASLSADQKLLSVFNERQYDRYLALCYDAIRTPIKINSTVVSDIQKNSVVDPE